MLFLRPNSIKILKPVGIISSARCILPINYSIYNRLYSTKSNIPENNSSINKILAMTPNILTLTRIGCAPLIGNYIFMNNLTPALYLFAYSCITDFLDGFIARRYNLKSVSGTVLDPMADKILMIVGTMSLTIAPGPQIIPVPIASLILGRDVLLGLSAFYIRYSSMKERYSSVTWRSYWDFFKYPSIEVKPTLISKWNTFLQMIYIGWAVAMLIVENREIQKDIESHEVTSVKDSFFSKLQEGFKYMGYIVSTTTVLSGMSYIFSRNTLRYLR